MAMIRLILVVMMVMIGVILVVMMEDEDLGIKRPSTLLFKILENFLIMMGEVDIGLRQDPIPTKI